MVSGARRRGEGAAGGRRGATPSAGRSMRGRRWAGGGAGLGSAARAGGRAGAPVKQNQNFRM